jgi:hypothetical protein
VSRKHAVGKTARRNQFCLTNVFAKLLKFMTWVRCCGISSTLFLLKIRRTLGGSVATYFWNGYRRYLDDGIIFWDKRIGNFSDIFDILNDIHPSINFTMERSDTELKYLDVLIYKTTTGFKTVVKNKDTDSGTFVHFESNHPRHCLDSIPLNMARRVKALTDDDDLAYSQMLDLKSKFLAGAYPVGRVNSAIQYAMTLSTVDLRNHSKRTMDDDVITFVHTFDPAYPELMKKIEGIISRLYSSIECQTVFAGTKIIDSLREPSNILRLLQRSRFDESGSTANVKCVTRCSSPQCMLCDQIMETDKVFFRNVGFYLRIGAKMDCTVRNVIYALFCNGCGKSYIGESVCFRDRINTHRSNSSPNRDAVKMADESVMEVSRHFYECGQGFRACPIFKVREECKMLRLVVEDYLIKLLKPDLNAPRRNILHLKAMDE